MLPAFNEALLQVATDKSLTPSFPIFPSLSFPAKQRPEGKPDKTVTTRPMATTATLSLQFLRPCYYASRPNTIGKPRNPPPKLSSRNSSRKLKSPDSSIPPPYRQGIGGGEATTFTRLPPKDDFYNDGELGLAGEIRLSELTAEEFAGKWGPDVETSEEEEDVVEEIWDYGDTEVFEGGDGGFEEFGDGDFVLMEDEEDGAGEEKEKGLPAVMRCFDRAKIFVKAGDGGNGVVAFRREKFVPFGGPSGGDGGRGGNVFVEVDGAMNSLLPFRKAVHFRAGKAGNGRGSKQVGAKGEDIVVKVAPGTVIREAVKGGVQGEVLLELMRPGQRALLLPGGRGGRGNASFKSGMNKVPKIAENGEEGAEM